MTLYHGSDQWIVVVTCGSIEASNALVDGDTKMWLYTADGTTQLGYNDDIGGGSH